MKRPKNLLRQSSTRITLRRNSVRVTLGLTAALCLLCAAVSIAYVLTGWTYFKLGRPPQLAAQLINTLVGVGFCVVIGHFWNRKFRRADLWKTVMEAMDKIAAGDFGVRLAQELPGDHPLKEFYARFNTMAEDLGRLEALRREFVSNVSHEIQTPITSIKGFTLLLRDADLEQAERARCLDIIDSESGRLSRLGENLLKLARLESDGASLSVGTFRLDRQLKDMVLAAEPLWAGKRLDVSVELPEATLDADKELLGQVWTNLIHNSIKFTGEGGSVAVSLERSGDHLLVRVRDSGAGIAPEHLGRIFERFYKADSARRWSEGGSGLGLAIAKKIVELHHGGIQVQSGLGEGTCVSVSLPLAGENPASV